MLLFFFCRSKLWELLVAGILLRIKTAKTAMFGHDVALLMLQGDKNYKIIGMCILNATVRLWVVSIVNASVVEIYLRIRCSR